MILCFSSILLIYQKSNLILYFSFFFLYFHIIDPDLFIFNSLHPLFFPGFDLIDQFFAKSNPSKMQLHHFYLFWFNYQFFLEIFTQNHYLNSFHCWKNVLNFLIFKNHYWYLFSFVAIWNSNDHFDSKYDLICLFF